LNAPTHAQGPALDIERLQLGNGLRVVLHRDDALPLVAVNLWYHAGSKNERPGKTGFAHLFEHMLFQGSAHVAENEHLRLVQSVGGVANGSTWLDRTNYYETLPAHCLELGLWLESDRMGYLLPAMTQDKLETQRAVVMNERRQRVDNQPYGRAGEILNERLYPTDHPYRWPVIGYMEDIEAATLQDVADFFRTYYAPANAVLTVAGDFDREHARDLVQSYFGGLEGSSDPPPPPLDTTATTSGDRYEQVEDDVGLARTYHAYRLPAFGNDSWYAADLLAHLLAAGKTSRLYRDLVYERELAQSVSCSVLPTEAEASFRIAATCRPGVDPAVVDEAIDEHLTAASSQPPEAAEIERMRNGILTSHYQALQSIERRADLLSMFTTFFDRPEDLGRTVGRYRQVEAGPIQEIAARYLHDDDRARVHVVPRASSS
jgi:predicted Zn-dependent peptidase